MRLYGSYSSQYSYSASAVVVASAKERVMAILELPMLSPLLALLFSPLQQCNNSFFHLAYLFSSFLFLLSNELLILERCAILMEAMDML